MRFSRRQFLRRGLPLGAALSLVVALFAEEREEAIRDFKLQAGNAVRTLKQAARQGRVDIVFSADVLKPHVRWCGRLAGRNPREPIRSIPDSHLT